MGDRTGFVWQQPPAYNRIDELAAAKWQRLKIQPSELCTDVEFLRRVSLDLTGLPPTADDVRAFVADTRDSRVKREEMVDRLIGSKEYIEYWTNKWADLLQVNRKFLGVEGAAAFRKWIREEVAQNTPYDQFVRQILTASGSNQDHPPASYFKILREPAPTMENTTHLFLGGALQLQQVPRSPLRALDPGPVLPDGGLLRPRRSEGRSGGGGQEGRRHGGRKAPSRSMRSSRTRAPARSPTTAPAR